MNNLLNFKSFLKFLGRNKAYTLIDVFGSVCIVDVCVIDSGLYGTGDVYR